MSTHWKKNHFQTSCLSKEEQNAGSVTGLWEECLKNNFDSPEMDFF